MQQIFEKADVQQDLQDHIFNALGLQTVADMVSYVEKATYESEWKDIVCAAFPVRLEVAAQAAVEASDERAARPAVAAVAAFSMHQQRLYVGRIRTAHRLSLGMEKEEEEDKASAKKEQYEADMEKPIDKETRLRLKTQWKKLHNWEPRASMKPGPKLRNRVVREFLALTLSNHELEKCVNSLQAKTPNEPDRHPIGPPGAESALIYERERPQKRKIETILHYFSALRLLMGTYAYCGTDRVPSVAFPGTTVEFFPWEVSHGYADDCMHKCLEMNMPEHARMRWLRLRDERTRAQMAHLINQGVPGGEALTQAWRELAHLWDMKDGVVAAETHSEAAGSSYMGGHAQQENTSSDSKAKRAKSDANPMKGVRLASQDNNRKKLCGAWNSVRGCNEPCHKKQRHACSVIGRDSQICLSREHNAQNCPIMRG